MWGGIVWRCNMWDGIVELGVRELSGGVLCGVVLCGGVLCWVVLCGGVICGMVLWN